jgi:hypothetical protein
MKLLGWKEDETTDVVFTPWSIVHIASGAAAKDIGLPFWWFEGLHLLYEVKDQTATDEYQNSFVNSVGDQVSGTLGHLIAKKTHSHAYVWLFLALWGGAVVIGNDYG